MTDNNIANIDDNNLFGGFEPRRIHLSKIEKAQGFLRHFEWGFSPEGENLYYIDNRALKRRKRERAKPRHR